MDKSSSQFFTQVGNNEFMQVIVQILNDKEMHVEVRVSDFRNNHVLSVDKKQNCLLSLKMGTSL